MAIPGGQVLVIPPPKVGRSLQNSITPRSRILVGVGAVAVVSFILGWLLS